MSKLLSGFGDTNSFMIGFDKIFKDLEAQFTRPQTNYPPHDIVRLSDTAFRIDLAVAGFTKSDISVILEKNILTVSGAKIKSVDELEDAPVYLHRGIGNRSFKKNFTLNDQVAVQSATVVDGILSINLERIVPEDEAPRTIPII